MHSDLDQAQRNHVMHEFKNERVDILVATDIVARGIDIDDITLVINYDVPYDAEDYVHRIGRTARAGDTGMAITFVSPEEQYRFSLIEKFLQKEIYRIPVPAEMGEAPAYNPTRESAQRGRGGRTSKSGKGGKRSGGSDKSPRAEGAERPPKQERQGRKERPARQEKKKEEIGAEQIEEVALRADESGKPRSEEKAKTGNRRKKGTRTQEESGAQTQNREAREQHTPQREGDERPKKKVIKKSERLQQDAEKQASDAAAPQEMTSRARSNHSRAKGDKPAGEETKRDKRTSNRSGNRQSNKPEQEAGKTVRSQSAKSPAPQSVKAEKTQTKSAEPEKKKRWSWWPFGKK